MKKDKAISLATRKGKLILLPVSLGVYVLVAVGVYYFLMSFVQTSKRLMLHGMIIAGMGLYFEKYPLFLMITVALVSLAITVLLLFPIKELLFSGYKEKK